MGHDQFLSGPGVAFPSYITALAKDRPDEVVITLSGERVTRAQLERESNRLSRELQSRGVVQGSLVALLLPNSMDWYRAALAVWKIGATPMPLPVGIPAPELTALLEISRPASVVMKPGSALVPTAFPVVDPASAGSFSDAPIEVTISPHWKAIPSGGSTGRPKIIVAEWPSSLDHDTGRRLLRIEANERILVSTPLHHNYAVMFSVLGMMMGCTLIVMPKFDAHEALRLITEHRIQVLPVVPTMMHRMLAALRERPNDYDLSSVRVLWHAAEPCPQWLKEEWIDLLGPSVIWELYGGTEQTGMTRLSGDEWLERRGSVGTLCDGEMIILDSDGQELPSGQVGEIYMRPGLSVAPRYHYLGAESWRTSEGWESIGDMGWVDEAGYLYLSDRRVDMFTVGGRNVYPAEVESCILQHPDVASCIVFGVPDADLGQVPYALIQFWRPVDAEDIQAFCRERVAGYKVPRTIESVTEPLRDDAGKARRAQLRDEVVRRRGMSDRSSEPGR